MLEHIRTRLRTSWEMIRTSYWFIPSLMLIGAAALSVAAVEIDHRWVPDDGVGLRRWFALNSAEGARAVLSTIAGSMITIAGVVFSITIVALTLASSQFGPRLLRNFMSDTSNQFVLGAFTSIFLYCLLVLRTVSGGEERQFIPHLSVSIGVALALAGLGVLIYFIHHTAISIQAFHIIARAADDLEETIDELFPEKLGEGYIADEAACTRGVPPDFSERSAPINAPITGYIRSVNQDDLLRFTRRHDLVVHLHRRPGHFVARGEQLASVWPRERITDKLRARLEDLIVIGPTRTPTQDAQFGIDQLVEVAARALSPGINDPFTAITCIDRLGAALCRLADRPLPSPYRVDGDGVLRVVAEPITFVDLARQAFEPIRQYGAGHALVVRRLLEALAVIAPHLRRPEDREALLQEADRIRAAATRERPDDPQRPHIDDAHRITRDALRSGRDPIPHLHRADQSALG